MREEFQAAEEGADGPMGSDRAYLKHRTQRIDFEDKVSLQA